MGVIKDKVKGTANIAGGRLKQGLGRDLNDHSMAGDGAGQELKGQGQRFLGDLKGTIGNIFSRLGSKVRRSG